ncbi:MAG: electron transfer flavoprotein subunit beta/FixA family protein [Alphaproteobacteria bacterium]|jgi:electron transfer flavoprotein beta subunit|nr:electron transfer flavoprotein subunit beta/FixA family protein [Alphaproteobacteria bacterium]MBT5389345.1 electron transfer flavoprotein subunit beta/FixA family protein [Alphaproteobacteria bacterium]MBT5540403.1 electron transfer flavoprotein subunit beta/FixA family protein [Alphaproteobacteria bacterium]
MKILVAIKRVVDYNVKVRVKNDQSGVELDHVKMSMNPFDEIAVEEAILFKERAQAKEVVVISIGPKECQETLRTALALGADRGIHILIDEIVRPLIAAKILKAIAEKESPQIIITGKQAIDDDSNQTGQMLAGLLGWPQGTFASKVKVDGQSVIVEREVDTGIETVKLSLPCVITTDLRLNEPRYPSLPNIMKAKQKPIEELTPKDMGIKIESNLKTVKVQEPPKREGGTKVTSTEELFEKLTQEAKVI